MASLDSLLTRQALEKGVVRQVLLDKAIGLRLRYIGTSDVSSVTVSTAASLILITVAVTDTFLFDDPGSGGRYYTTLGALCDDINATGRWEAKIIDALRSEDPDSFFINGAVTAGTDENGVVCYDVLVDTSAAETMAACLSPIGPNLDMPKGHRVHLLGINYAVDNTAGPATLKIYKRKGMFETLLYSSTNIDDGTLTSVSWVSGHGMISGGVDEELIVFFDGTVADAATLYISLIGLYE